MSTAFPKPGRTRIKICGVRDAETARLCAENGADAVGLMFVKASPRFIEPAEAFGIAANLPPFVASVGVFADHTLDEFLEIEEACPTTLVQLHGSEPPKLVQQCGPNLIRAFKYDAANIERDVERWASLEEVDALMVDGSAGGLGEPFDWHAFAPVAARCPKPVVLAGGLTPENVAEAIRAVRPYAVDVSSGVESEKGVKDPARIEAFCRAVREADRG